MEKQDIENYCPASLCLICGNIFEGLTFNGILSIFLANKLISSNQSSFKPGDLYAHKSYKSFDDGLEVARIF